MITRGMFTSSTGEWSTPQSVFDALDAEFHFTLDACATSENAKCAKFYAKEQDGLVQEWPGVVWCNPPYGRDIGRWICKGFMAAQNGSTVISLIPSLTDTAWWHYYVMKADDIRFVRGRLKFGGTKCGAPFPSAIVVFRGR